MAQSHPGAVIAQELTHRLEEMSADADAMWLMDVD
jgi:hypothetical protein